MTSNPFHFKKFSIQQTRAAFKVGTDSALLGAWTDVSHAKRILDAGAGTGLLSLMCAQRNPNAFITSIEKQQNSYKDLTLNVENSDFSSRISSVYGDFLRLPEKRLFDLIISNPPYFENQLPAANKAKTTARHREGFSLADWIAKCEALLTEDGKLALILPLDQLNTVEIVAHQTQLYLHKLTKVKPTPQKSASRVLILLGKSREESSETELVVEISRHVYSNEFKALLQSFYLAF